MAEAKTEEMGVKKATKKIQGTVVLVKKKNVLDFDSHHSAILDSVHEVFGRKVSVQLISAKNGDPANKLFFWGPKVRGKLGKPAHLKNWLSTRSAGGESKFEVSFDWDEEIDVPGAFLIRNHHHSEFYLKTVTLVPEGVENQGPIHFVCNSWVYPNSCYKKDRIFFFNKPFLPCDTPLPLQKYREEELLSLRGDGKAKLEEWDRVYDYAIYNDLGDPDKGPEYVRPILGGSTQYPYPRRGRTGRPPSKSDPKTESRLSIFKSLSIYVPRDERFSHLKMSDFLAFALKSIAPVVKAELTGLDFTPDEFDCFQDVLKIYRECATTTVSRSDLLDSIQENNSSEVFRELIRTEGEGHSKLPMPQIIKEDNSAWRSDEEFGREMLAGLNPLVIQRLQVFPPVSQSDKKTSSITKEHIEKNMDGLTVDEAMMNNKLFILDHYDALMPYLGKINSETSTKTYATRTILFLKEDGTLKPLAIELSLPDKSEVYTPAENGIEGHLWQLAKAYVAVNDSGHHQLISHWLRTHATMEPFIIATNRQLSVLHPIHKLLCPHFRDTMTVNALSRQILINAGGLLEMTVFPCKFSMEISSQVYKNWVFPDQALPEDLIKRGVAVRDDKAQHGVTLLIKDYPYAVDGLEIWSAIKTWVQDYCLLYYKSDEMVQEDPELQSWWKEVREKGHGDKKHETWWPKMQTRKELIQSCTIIIWVASALHAAVNFGQYPYGGYLPNRPSISRKLMPEKETLEKELENHPDHEAYFQKDFLRTITAQFQTLLGISLIEVLSKHTSDEVYLGQRDTPDWTSDEETLKAFEKFGNNLRKIEEKITSLNGDESLKNRVGPVKMPYTLLYPSSEIGLTGKGIPNSVSI